MYTGIKYLAVATSSPSIPEVDKLHLVLGAIYQDHGTISAGKRILFQDVA
jgi:hypothetical protein